MAGKNLTPKELMMQWKTVPSRFGVNVFNFRTQIGKAARKVFQDSFYLGRFNSAGEFAWKPRTRTYSHPILNETGTLRESIVWKHVGTTTKIYTDPSRFNTSARHRGFCYAAIHNDPDGRHTYGASMVPSVQRKFMGHSTVLRDLIRKYSKTIFDGFPQ